MYYISDVPPHHNKLSGPGPRTKHGRGARVGDAVRAWDADRACQVYSKKNPNVGRYALDIFMLGASQNIL